MVLIVNTTADTAVTDELKKKLEERSVDAEIIEAYGLKISHCIGCTKPLDYRPYS